MTIWTSIFNYLIPRYSTLILTNDKYGSWYIYIYLLSTFVILPPTTKKFDRAAHELIKFICPSCLHIINLFLIKCHEDNLASLSLSDTRQKVTNHPVAKKTGLLAHALNFKRLSTNNIDVTQQGQFLMSDSQIHRTCSF